MERIWSALDPFVPHVPSAVLAAGGAIGLILSHLESGLNRTATSLAALAMIATVSWRAWKMIGKQIRRSDSLDKVIETVPNLVKDVSLLHLGQDQIKEDIAHLVKIVHALHRLPRSTEMPDE